MSHGFKLVTNGTDNHLILIDIQTSFGIDGAEAENIFDRIGLTLNKNSIPNDTASPFKPSGVRLGTPAITSRGMKLPEMVMIAKWMSDAIKARADDSKLNLIHQEVKQLCLKFPLPSDS